MLALPSIAATPGDLLAAREQMAFSLGWHIILACFGVGMPAFTVFAEWRGHPTGDEAHVRAAHRRGNGMGVLFARGRGSGAVACLEMGLPVAGLVSTYGHVLGPPLAVQR